MFGAAFPRTSEPVKPLEHQIGLNSEVFTKGDVVTMTSGFLDLIDAGTERVVGVVDTTMTMASDNQTVAKRQVPYTPFDYNEEFEMDFNADAALANQGQYFTLTGASGAQQVALSSADAAVGQVLLVKLDPRQEGSLRRGLFRAALGQQTFEPETA